MLLFCMPIFIGWTALGSLIVEGQKLKILEFFLNIYKSVGLISFMYYIDRMMGWVRENDENKYSKKERQECLMRVKQAKCIYGCIKPSPLTTPDEADWYVRKTYIGVLQLSLVLMAIGIGELIVYFFFYDTYHYQGPAHFSLKLVALSAKIISSIIAINYLFNFSHFAHHIPELEKLNVTMKFVIVKLTMMFTEIQPLFILVLAEAGWVASDKEYTVDEMSNYTNSLLLCSEMILVGFLQILIFPVEDFSSHPEHRKKLKDHKEV